MIIAQRGRPKILHPVRTEYGKQIRKAYERGDIQEKRANIQQYEPRDDGICNTITTVLKDNLVLRKVGRMELPKSEIYDNDETWEQQSETEELDEIPATGEETVDDYLYRAKDGEYYGIFKLSPRECLRLMDVHDADIDKMLAVNSRSQCYKQAGNSIVVAVLSAIFSQLNIKGVKPWNDRNADERKAILGFKH